MPERKKVTGNLRTREFEGNTIEDAITQAMKELNLPKEKLRIKILTEGHHGLFGMQGVKKAKIQVTAIVNETQLS